MDRSVNVIDQRITDHFALYHGDCVEVIKGVADNSVHFSIFSPPFAKLFAYSNSEHDMGNCRGYDDFGEHFGFLIDDLHRVMMPGRLVAIHCMDIPLMKERDGVMGFSDFSGDIIRWFQARGFIMHGPRITIWKDPLIEATRTKALGLMHKQLCKDSAMSRTGNPDYLVVMRKDGDNPEAVARPDGLDRFVGMNEPRDGVYSHEAWRRYANPVWADINQTRTLNAAAGRDEKDQTHICPLQLDVIERAIHLWTNPGDIVFTPFAGIGSEVYGAILQGRRGIGIELKESYFRQAVANCERAVSELKQDDLVSMMDHQEAANE